MTNDDRDPFECGSKDIGETEVTSTVEIRESTVYQLNRQNDPTVKIYARYPSGGHDISFPLFAGPLYGDQHLEQVIRYHDHPSDSPTFAAIYGTPWVVVYQRPVEDYPKSDDYSTFDRVHLRDDNFGVLWDATWDETTDPMRDIKHGDDQIPDGNHRLTRPWEKEEKND